MVERFLDRHKSAAVRKTFVGIYSLAKVSGIATVVRDLSAGVYTVLRDLSGGVYTVVRDLLGEFIL